MEFQVVRDFITIFTEMAAKETLGNQPRCNKIVSDDDSSDGLDKDDGSETETEEQSTLSEEQQALYDVIFPKIEPFDIAEYIKQLPESSAKLFKKLCDWRKLPTLCGRCLYSSVNQSRMMMHMLKSHQKPHMCENFRNGRKNCYMSFSSLEEKDEHEKNCI